MKRRDFIIGTTALAALAALPLGIKYTDIINPKQKAFNYPKKLGFGFMRLPVLDENDRSTVNFQLTEKMVDLYMERGFSYFDTAHRYNDEMSETALRKTLTSRYARDKYILADKITMNYIKRKEDQEPFLRKQLEICGVEYFDNYLVHNMGESWYPVAQKFETFDFIKQMKKKGLVKHIGFSFHGYPETLEQILKEHPEVEFVQLQINYLDWKDPGVQSETCYNIVRKYGKRIFVMEPIKGGTLINLPEEALKLLKEADPNASIASWAIRFAASLEGVDIVLSGMSTPEQVEDNTSYMQNFKPLSPEEFSLLEKVADIIRKNTAIACTNCRYCVTECPKKIAIADYFALYNNKKRLKNTGYMSSIDNYYVNLTKTHGKASDCIGCGICEKNCPQKLPIRKLLKDVAAEFENIKPSKISNKHFK